MKKMSFASSPKSVKHLRGSRLIIASLLLIIPLSLFGNSGSSNLSTLTISLSPRYEIPLFESTNRFTEGLSAQFSLAYLPPIPLPLYVSLDLGYTYLPFTLTWANPLHSPTAGGGIGLDFRFLGRLAGNVYIKGGYYETIIKDLNGKLLYGGNPYIDAGGGLAFYLSPNLRIGIGASYRQFFGKPDDLFKGLGFYMGTSYRFPLSGSIEIEPTQRRASKLKITKIKMEQIFPVFFKYYDDHPIGKATIVNEEKGNINDITVSFFIKHYMDNPKTHRVKNTLKKGDSMELDIFALFNEKVLEITEGTKVSSKLTIRYNLKGETIEKNIINTVSLYNRNASIWDDDRRAAAFITARDPVILRLSKNLAGIIREEQNKVFGKNFMSLDAIHNALSEYGVTYVIDPKTPYREFHKKRQAIDFLQFPRQTLEYRAGDCDDLSILYAALLEALSINTALITVPGHIYIAVDLGLTPREARAIFYSTENLIIKNNTVWLPFEITMVQSPFIEAWREGAMEWNKYNSTGKARFYPVSEAWKIFEPVGLPGNLTDITLPLQEKIKSRLARDMKSITRAEIKNKAKELKERIAKSGSYKLINKLGVLYARYGLYKEAQEQFKRLLEKPRYRDIGLINLGNIRYKMSNFKDALKYYNLAKKSSPDNAKLLLNIAKINYKLGEFSSAQKLFEKARIISPEIAKHYRYLDQRTDTKERAASSQEEGNILWEE